MKVGTRITLATSAIVTLTLGLYALLDLRQAARDRRLKLEREARDIAVTVRAGFEATGVGEALLRFADSPRPEVADRALARAQAVAASVARSGAPWRVTVLPAALIDGASPGVTRAQIARLRAIIDAPEVHLAATEGEQFVYVVPLRVSTLQGFEVAGSVEISRRADHLQDAFYDDLWRTLLLVIAIVAVTLLAVTWLTRTVMTRPMEKLLAGIDDVARGDLSRVLLSERDDEIGALATRFNEMTASLRESQSETSRQNEARLELEQRLNQTEKLATIGQLAAEIAHEVGTPLNVIAGRSKRLQKRVGDEDAVSKSAAIISEQTARITRIIQRLLDFTRRKVGGAGPTPVDLNAIAVTTLELLESKLAVAKVSHTFDRADDLPAVRGDPDRLQQVLLNLVLNAIQATPEGGAVRIETTVVTRRRPGLEVAPEQVWVVLQVADTGAGIPAEKREKIFEPFYTSKTGDGGTGLGLAVCFGIVKEHDGWIELGDAPGGGAVFSVYLPVAGTQTTYRARRDTLTQDVS